MKLFNEIRNLFAVATIAETIRSETVLETEKIRQYEVMIENLKFEKSLSEAKLVAMLNWEASHPPVTLIERNEHDDHSSY